jgi:hypothetical protein
VDDLDRCLPQGALDVLEAMKLFFDLEGFVFVVGLDQSVVERSIDLKYRSELTSSSGSDNGAYQIRGADYIKKIFQVPFSVAPVAMTQLDEFLTAVYNESKLAPEQIADFQKQVAPHLRYVVTDSGVNPREIKRYLNAFTLGIKIKPYLDRNVVLALQTVAFRRDWDTVRRAIFSCRDIFIDALRRQVVENDFTAVADLDPTLTGVPESFLSYVSAPNPGAALITAHNLDEYIYSGEATRSSLSTMFIDAIRDVAQLSKHLRQLQATTNVDVPAFQAYSSKVSTALSEVQQAGGPRFSRAVKEWLDHVSVAGSQVQASTDDPAKKQWISEEETFIRRVVNQLMEVYQFGSTAIAAS